MGDRFVLLGLAPARSEWFRTVGRWSATAALPAEFIRCVSLDELQLRLASGRPFSAVLLDGALPGIDRDLVATAVAAGAAVLVVDDERRRDWPELGAAAVLASRFSRDELLEVLQATATPVGAAVLDGAATAPPPRPGEDGELIAVTGPGGTGASTVAIALAQGLAVAGLDRHSPGAASPSVLLADLCRTADQAMLHDSRVLIPSVQEVVEAHRAGVPDLRDVQAQTFAVPERRYRLLLGLRRPRLWVALRPRALASALSSLLRLADVVVADVEADVEGEADTGSTDVQDRNLLARETLGRADLVVLVAEPSMKGLHAAVRTLADLVAYGVPCSRIVPVLNRTPRSPRARGELTATFAELAAASIGPDAAQLAPPLHLPERPVDAALRDGVALPAGMASSLVGAVGAVRARATAPRPLHATSVPVPVVPGSLSAFTAPDRPGA